MRNPTALLYSGDEQQTRFTFGWSVFQLFVNLPCRLLAGQPGSCFCESGGWASARAARVNGEVMA